MRLENIVWDARDPHRLGRIWAAGLGAELITVEPDLVEARLQLTDDVFLDLCFPRVADPSTSPARLHPDLLGGAGQQDVVRRLLDLGAARADIGQGTVPWVVLADPEGNTFCVMDDREAYRDTGPIAALPLDSADPDRDADFWAEITGWVRSGRPETSSASWPRTHFPGFAHRSGPVCDPRGPCASGVTGPGPSLSGRRRPPGC